MAFSKQARRLALALSNNKTGADPLVFPDSPSSELPTKVPLDRRRGILLSSMDEQQLLRARIQAQNRVGRTQPSADRRRYELQLAAIQSEFDTRAEKTETAPQALPESEPRKQTTAPGVPPDPILGITKGNPVEAALAAGVDFTSGPTDTPEGSDPL